MVIRSRGEIVQHTDIVQLQVTFRSLATGLPADLVAFPTVTISQPSGNVYLSSASAGIYRLSAGVYGYDLSIGINSSPGVWRDRWVGRSADGYFLNQELNFVVWDSNMPYLNSMMDGYGNTFVALGDDPGFNYSQVALQNINKLLKALKMRLHSSGKSKSVDQFGQTIYNDCDIFSVEMLTTFLSTSLAAFNEIPYFTMGTFDDTEFINQFFAVLVQGAALYALASKALIERGREYSISDNGISLTPPSLSEALTTQYTTELNNHTEKVKQIKASLRPAPLGLSQYSSIGGRNPAIDKLRHLRARRLW